MITQLSDSWSEYAQKESDEMFGSGSNEARWGILQGASHHNNKVVELIKSKIDKIDEALSTSDNITDITLKKIEQEYYNTLLDEILSIEP